MAARRNTTKTPRKMPAPHNDRVRISPMNPDELVRLASSGKFRNTNPNMTTPSKTRSTMMVAKRGRHWYTLPFAQDISPQYLSCPIRVDIVTHVPDGYDREHLTGRNHFQRSQQVMPTPRPCPESQKIDSHTWQQPDVICCSYYFPHGTKILITECKIQQQPG